MVYVIFLCARVPGAASTSNVLLTTGPLASVATNRECTSSPFSKSTKCTATSRRPGMSGLNARLISVSAPGGSVSLSGETWSSSGCEQNAATRLVLPPPCTTTLAWLV